MKTVEVKLGQFDFDDGGSYVGGCDGGKANGYGVCTGPQGQGEFCGLWQAGFEISGVFSWSKDNKYAGQWMQGKRHGLGVENKGHWIYMGEWTQGCCGRYGVRQSTKSHAKYEGTWTQGLQDGYGLETYADLGTYQGQWLKGSRHGYGVRKSATYSNACFIQDHGKRSSLTSVRSSYNVSAVGTPQSEVADKLGKSHLDADMMRATKIGHFLASSKFNVAFKQIYEKNESKGSFKNRSRSAIRFLSGALKPKLHKREQSSDAGMAKRNNRANINGSLRQPLGGDTSNTDTMNSENALFFLGPGLIDDDTIEIYAGEWKNDKRDGYGVCERSDGTKYEGEWLGNRRNGFGITYYSDGMKEEGQYKDDILLADGHKKKWLTRKKRERERVAAAVASAQKAAQLANQKSDIANSRMESARSKASIAGDVKNKAINDAEKAKMVTVEIKKIEMENEREAKKGTKKLTKKPSIPRHTMMNHNPNRQARQYELNPYQQQHLQPSSSQQSSQYTSYDNTSDISNEKLNREKLFKPLRPNSLKLNSGSDRRIRRSSIEEAESAERSNSISNSLPHVSSSSYSTNVLSEEIENMFSYLNNEDRSTDNADRGSLQSHMRQHAKSIDHPNLISTENVNDENDPNKRYLNDSYQHPPPSSNNQNLSSLAFVSNTLRRLTLPSIVKLKDITTATSTNQDQRNAKNKTANSYKPTKNSIELEGCTSMDSNVLILDTGGRRIIEQIENENVILPKLTDVDTWQDDKPSELPKIVKVHQFKPTTSNDVGSMPDVSRLRKISGKVMSWREVGVLCQQTRAELKRKQELELDLRKRSIVIRIGDFKCWLRKNCIFLVIIVINISFIYLFTDLMRH